MLKQGVQPGVLTFNSLVNACAKAAASVECVAHIACVDLAIVSRHSNSRELLLPSNYCHFLLDSDWLPSKQYKESEGPEVLESLHCDLGGWWRLGMWRYVVQSFLFESSFQDFSRTNWKWYFSLGVEKCHFFQAMVTISVASDLSPAHQTRPNLRLLCLHGHGGTPAGLCGNLEVFFQNILNAKGNEGPEVCDPKTDILAIECRCVPGILPESRRVGGRQWWRYDEDGCGDRPADWAEMELATTKLAEELWTAQEADLPFDGILGFSQGAEMVHTIALLKHQGDPRFQGLSTPRFVVSFSGAINPAHFESISGGGPPRDCPGPYLGPKTGEFFGDSKETFL